jgi:fructose-1,6-bisphosphatase/inositol monophosphatase family enzyme
MEVFERVAALTVEEASAMLLASWRDAKTIEYKGAVDIVTETDRAIESAIVARLSSAFPDHVVIAEESASDATLVRPPRDRYVWYLGPARRDDELRARVSSVRRVARVRAGCEDLLFGIVHDPVRNEDLRGGTRARRTVE